MTESSRVRSRRAAVWLGLGLGVAVVAYVGVQVFGVVVSTEGAVPDVSRIPLPPGAEVVGEPTLECASGGCWVTVTVLPPVGQSPADTATAMGATPQLVVPGTLFDVRPVYVSTDPGDDVLTVRADYWSAAYVP